MKKLLLTTMAATMMSTAAIADVTYDVNSYDYEVGRIHKGMQLANHFESRNINIVENGQSQLAASMTVNAWNDAWDAAEDDNVTTLLGDRDVRRVLWGDNGFVYDITDVEATVHLHRNGSNAWWSTPTESVSIAATGISIGTLSTTDYQDRSIDSTAALVDARVLTRWLGSELRLQDHVIYEIAGERIGDIYEMDITEDFTEVALGELTETVQKAYDKGFDDGFTAGYDTGFAAAKSVVKNGD